MKQLVMTAAILLAGASYALADDGVRCGPTGQFVGYGAITKSIPCWVHLARADATATE